MPAPEAPYRPKELLRYDTLHSTIENNHPPPVLPMTRRASRKRSGVLLPAAVSLWFQTARAVEPQIRSPGNEDEGFPRIEIAQQDSMVRVTWPMDTERRGRLTFDLADDELSRRHNTSYQKRQGMHLRSEVLPRRSLFLLSSRSRLWTNSTPMSSRQRTSIQTTTSITDSP